MERMNTADNKAKMTVEQIAPVLAKSSKNKNPPFTANLSIYKN